MADQKLSALTQGTKPDLLYGVDQSTASKKFKSLRIYNVLDYGADPTNVSASDANIQLAIADCTNNTPAGGTIYFPPGTYKITKSLYVEWPGSYTFLGSGNGSSVLSGSITGFLLAEIGQLGGGSGNTITITNAVSGTAGVIRLTIDGTAFVGTPANPTYAFILQNVPYTISGVVGGSGNVSAAALNGTRPRFTWVDGNHIEINGSTFSGAYGSGGSITGGTQTATMCVEHLGFSNATNSHGCGGLYIGMSTLTNRVHDCQFNCFIGIDFSGGKYLGGTYGTSVQDCYINGTSSTGKADKSDLGYAGHQFGSIGVYMGQGSVTNCRIQGFDVGITMGGQGQSVRDCSVEISNTGILVGTENYSYISGLVGTASGISITGFQCEQVQNGIYIQSCNGGLFAGNELHAFIGIPAEADISLMAWTATAGGTVTVTTLHPHNLGAASTVVGINLGSGGITPSSYVTGVLDSGNVSCIVTGASTFTYLQPNIAADPGFTSGQWTLAPVSAIVINGNVQSLTFAGNNTSSFHSITNRVVDLSTFTGQSCVFMANEMASGIKVPPAVGKAAWKFISAGTFSGPSLSMNFADLPGQAGVSQPGPFEGQEFYIVDANTGTLGNSVTAGGAPNTHGYVVYNGSNWTLMSK